MDQLLQSYFSGLCPVFRKRATAELPASQDTDTYSQKQEIHKGIDSGSKMYAIDRKVYSQDLLSFSPVIDRRSKDQQRT